MAKINSMKNVLSMFHDMAAKGPVLVGDAWDRELMCRVTVIEFEVSNHSQLDGLLPFGIVAEIVNEKNSNKSRLKAKIPKGFFSENPEAQFAFDELVGNDIEQRTGIAFPFKRKIVQAGTVGGISGVGAEYKAVEIVPFDDVHSTQVTWQLGTLPPNQVWYGLRRVELPEVLLGLTVVGSEELAVIPEWAPVPQTPLLVRFTRKFSFGPPTNPPVPVHFYPEATTRIIDYRYTRNSTSSSTSTGNSSGNSSNESTSLTNTNTVSSGTSSTTSNVNSSSNASSTGSSTNDSTSNGTATTSSSNTGSSTNQSTTNSSTSNSGSGNSVTVSFSTGASSSTNNSTSNNNSQSIGNSSSTSATVTAQQGDRTQNVFSWKGDPGAPLGNFANLDSNSIISSTEQSQTNSSSNSTGISNNQSVGTSTSNNESTGTSNNTNTTTSTSQSQNVATGTSESTNQSTSTNEGNSTTQSTNFSVSSNTSVNQTTNQVTSTTVSFYTSTNNSQVNSSSQSNNSGTNTTVSSSSSVSSSEVGALLRIALPKCLHDTIVVTAAGQTVTFPATNPTTLPFGQWLLVSSVSDHLRHGIWFEETIEAFIP